MGGIFFFGFQEIPGCCACTWEDRSICGFAIWVSLSCLVMSLTTATKEVKINATNALADEFLLQPSQTHSHVAVRIPGHIFCPFSPSMFYRMIRPGEALSFSGRSSHGPQ